MVKVLVCGGRNYTNEDRLFKFLHDLHTKEPISRIIHGGARGADTLAGVWADANGIEKAVYEAEWKRYGNSAGPRRNYKMLMESHPDYVVACRGGSGTQHMVNLALTYGYTVLFADLDVQREMEKLNVQG